nr:mucin-7-like [Nicotiana tomentosiformis]
MVRTRTRGSNDQELAPPGRDARGRGRGRVWPRGAARVPARAATEEPPAVSAGRQAPESPQPTQPMPPHQFPPFQCLPHQSPPQTLRIPPVKEWHCVQRNPEPPILCKDRAVPPIPKHDCIEKALQDIDITWISDAADNVMDVPPETSLYPPSDSAAPTAPSLHDTPSAPATSTSTPKPTTAQPQAALPALSMLGLLA